MLKAGREESGFRVTRRKTIAVFDSGLGGLTVLAEIARLQPDDDIIYLADDAAFPYGGLGEDVVVSRVMRIVGAAIVSENPDVVVIACNTASTLVLPHLRAQYPDVPFVGTVPAIKPAAERSRSGMISVLATPGTVTRDYTQALIRDHAAHCEVTLVGSERLAGLAEQHMHGKAVDDADIAAEIAPCFAERDGKRTDHIVLACTHYPLLRAQMERLAGSRVGWPVEFLDPAEAIARRVAFVLDAGRGDGSGTNAADSLPRRVARFTRAGPADAQMRQLLLRYGLELGQPLDIPFETV